MPDIPVTWRGQQTVNTVLAGSQSDPDIIQLANGNILVSWTSTSDTGAGSAAGLDVIGQLFDPLGNRIGVEFRLNADHFLDEEQDMDMAASLGGFISVYEDTNANGTSIRLNEFDVNGATLPDDTTVVEDNSTASPNYRNPRIAVSGTSSALIVYEETSSGPTSLRGKIYNPVTNAYGAEITIFVGGMFTITNFTGADVAVLTNGNYVVTANQSGVDPSITYKILNSAGATVLASDSVSGTNTNNDVDGQASVTSLAGGGFVIVFANTDGPTKIEYRVFNAAGTQTASGIAGPTGPNLDSEPVVTGLADGGFVVVLHDNELQRMTVSHISAAGVKLGNFIFAADGSAPAVTELADGRFAVTWRDSATNEIVMEILDTRDGVNNPAVYAPDKWVVGTAGDDVFTPGSAGEIVHGWTGNDIITESNGAGSYFGDAGSDTIIVTSPITTGFHDGGTNNDLIDWSGSLEVGATFNLAAGTAADTALNVEQMLNFESLTGTAFRDIIIGTGGVNLLNGGSGNDDISGGNGDDALVGGAGNDMVHGDANNDTLLMDDYTNPAATNGVDTGYGDAGADLLWGYGGNDTLYGGTENDALVGNDYGSAVAGLDGLYGGDGLDTLFVGLGGNAYMDGGAGNDTFYAGLINDTLRGGLGNDYLYGNAGGDHFLFYQADFVAGNTDIVYFVDAGDKLRFSASMSGTLTFTNTILQYDANPAHTVASVYITVALGGGQTAAIAVYGATVASLTPMVEFTL
jgi:Ca2+-binding RTX toxin-like protein